MVKSNHVGNAEVNINVASFVYAIKLALNKNLLLVVASFHKLLWNSIENTVILILAHFTFSTFMSKV